MLIVNLFAGPGAGKSTLMALVFGLLKMDGVCAEMAPEFAKEVVWEKRYGLLHCQEAITGEQVWRVQRLAESGCDVVVTDSPVMLGTAYAPEETADALGTILHAAHSRYQSINYRVRRTKPYEPRGRRQSEDSARAMDRKIDRLLVRYGIETEPVTSTLLDAALIAQTVKASL